MATVRGTSSRQSLIHRFGMAKRLLLADIDNTLYDWAGFFAPSFRAMVSALVRVLGVPEEQVYDEFRQVFARHRSLEYAFAIQELESVRRFGTNEVRNLIRNGRGAFLHVQRARLQPYPGVEETLRWLTNHGITVVGISNSPLYRAQNRLYDLKLDSFLSGLVAWEGFQGDDGPSTRGFFPESEPGLQTSLFPEDDGLRMQGFVPQSRQRRQTRLPLAIGVPSSDCKPNATHYSTALDAFGEAGSEAWVIGDSLAKDLAPAAELGLKTIWARYGASSTLDAKDVATLRRITHWSESEIQRTYSTEGFSPDFTIDSIQELREIVPPMFFSLFEGAM